MTNLLYTACNDKMGRIAQVRTEDGEYVVTYLTAQSGKLNMMHFFSNIGEAKDAADSFVTV